MYTKLPSDELEKWEWHIAGANRHGEFDFDTHKLLTKIWQALYFATHKRNENTDFYEEGTDEISLMTNATEALGYVVSYAKQIKDGQHYYHTNEIYTLCGKLSISLEEAWRVDRRRTKKVFKTVHEVCMELKMAIVFEWAKFHLKDPVCT